MKGIHHSAICVRDFEVSLRFWRDGIGLTMLMDEEFEGDWPTLLRAPTTKLRSAFLGDPDAPDSGLVELVDLGDVVESPSGSDASSGFLLLSLMIDLDETLARLVAHGFDGPVRRVEVQGTAMAVVTDPNGVQVELIDIAAVDNLDGLMGGATS